MTQCPEHKRYKGVASPEERADYEDRQCLGCWKVHLNRRPDEPVTGQMMMAIIEAFQAELDKTPEQAAAHIEHLIVRGREEDDS
jgi:hypothetical protein